MKTDVCSSAASRGFTLVEMLVVVALLALMAVIATPSFVAWHVRDQVDARAHALLTTLTYARSEAQKRGRARDRLPHRCSPSLPCVGADLPLRCLRTGHVAGR